MLTQWQENIAHARAIRRHLHTHPELSWQEHATATLIREQLDGLSIPWRSCADTGTLAWINPEGQQPSIALRGDIDALAITEETGKKWQSTHTGCMHACGHDGHTATLLAAAAWLKQHEQQLQKKIVLIFQPAEEGGHGAREMINDGALDGVGEIYGWHNWPAFSYRQFACPDGLVMCGNGTFTINITGRGGHASQPELCADPVLAASAVTQALQHICSRRLPPQKTAVVSVTRIQAGHALTVIPQYAELSGSIRIPDEETRIIVTDLITEIAIQTCAAYDVQCDVSHQVRYGATINHAPQAKNARSHWQQLYGNDSLVTVDKLPIMASEDFSYYLRERKGAFALIGARDNNHHTAPCHSPHYDFNDDLIEDVCRWFCRLSGMRLPP